MSKTLLLADDSVTIQKVVGISFASEDIAITTVDNGNDAVAKTRELRPDVVLADVVMPGKSGYEVCEAIKADAELRHIPVLLLTGTFEAFDEERAAQAGAAGHVAKPFEAQTLVDRVKELLAQAPPPARDAAPATPAPAPAAVAAAVEAPALRSDAQPATPPASRDNSFDFFDDNVNEFASRDGDPAGATPDEPADESLDFDSPDSAFAFGDDELTGPDDAPALQPAPSALPPADHTVAILPDDPPERLPSLAGLEAAAREEPSADAPLLSERPAAADEAFDFEFETARPDRDSVDAEDLARAAVLDPGSGPDFDVSSSDLGPAEPAATVLSAPAGLSQPEPPAGFSQPESPPASLAAPEGDPLGGASLQDDPVMDLLAPEPGAPEAGSARDDWDAVTAPGDTDSVMDVAAVEAADPLESTWDSSSAPVEELDGPLAPPPPQPKPAAGPAAAPAAPSADEALERIAPALRGQIHETLEKVAWESFGSATEQIVEKAVERIEAIAWEIVPKLAETLIQEEIRRLKGGDEDA